MSLIHCTECKTLVSDLAEKCPNCAYPIREKQSTPPFLPVENKVQTIEKTGKKLKLLMLLCVMGLCFSVVACLGGAPEIGAPVFLGSFLMLVVAKLLVWWDHG